MGLFSRRKKPQAQRSDEPNISPQELPTSSASRTISTVNPFLKRGDELFDNGDHQNAVFMYQEALREDQDNALLCLKSCLARTLLIPPQLEEALQDANAAIQRDPSMGAAWKQKGEIYLRKGDYSSAEDAVRQAIAMLQGWEKAQAQHLLVQIRTSNASNPASSTMPAIQVPNAFPGRSNVQAVFNNPQVTTTNTLPTRSAPAHSTLPVSQSSMPYNHSANLSPLSATSTLSSSNIAYGAGTHTSPGPSHTRSPSPLPLAQSEVLAQQLNIPTEAPPQYSPPPLPPNLATNTSSFAYGIQSTNLKDALAVKRHGSLSLAPYTAEGQIDSIQLLFHGKTYIESILLDLPPQPQVHQTWKMYHCDTIAYPGTTFLDLDCESAASHEGYHHGTTSVTGYTEEYREYQLLQVPLLNLLFEAQTVPPVMTIDKIVERILRLQSQPTLEDNKGLAEILGLASPLYDLSATRQTSIEDICMSYHRGQFDTPARFIDFLTTASFSGHIFGAAGIGLSNFLFHILLGAELYIRLKAAGTGTKYPSIMTNKTSALVVIAQQWMVNVTIRVVRPLSADSTGVIRNKYTLVANNHAQQSEGLIRFAESLAWPYLDEARQNIETAYNSLIANPNNIHDYLKDWLYGLCLPGKYFRHRIMSCLVLASSSSKHIGSAPYYDNGLVVGNKSYWPKRTVLGRVLGGMTSSKSTCGWIGPVPAPAGFPSGWVLLNARRVNFAVPALDDLTETNLEILGFSEADAAADPQGVIREISDLSLWNPPNQLPTRASPSTATATNTTDAVSLEAIRLNEVVETGAAAIPGTRQYRAKLDFLCHGRRIEFTLYSNPIFVHVPKCVGASHPIHQRKVRQHLENIVLAKNLKDGSSPLPPPGQHSLTIIDATEPGEEAIARAWCAESGRHAVVRKNSVGCFTCATNLAASRTGLGFGVLIWCR